MPDNIERYFLQKYFLALLCFCLGAGLHAQQSLENYLERASAAQQLQNYNLAIKILREAQQKYPTVSELWFRSGELYEGQNLLHLGLESYLRAQALAPQNTSYIYRVANLQDRLGKYAEALQSFRSLEQWGDAYERNEARRKNGWLLYKLHRYAEAEASILAIPAKDRSSGTMMTLAIIYSAAYNYKKSRQAYEQSLALTYPRYGGELLPENANPNVSPNVNQRALVYFNYALLETDFYHFERAMELNDKSIENIAFSSNELLRGELYLQQRHFSRAREAFIKSQRLEEQSSNPSPLALLDLVQLAIDRGQNEEGMFFLRAIEKQFGKQTEWMTSYGIDSINFELELMHLRSALYSGLLQEQKWLLPLNAKEYGTRALNLLKHSWLYWYATIRQKLLAHRVGKEHYRQGNELDSSQNLYEASNRKSLLRRLFFRKFKVEQQNLVPDSKAVLLLEEGILEGSSQKIIESLQLLDTKWQAPERENAYIALSRLRRQPYRRYLNLLHAYQSNRAALKLRGIALPLQLQFSGSAAYQGEQQLMKRQLQRYLQRSGAEIVSDPTMPVLRLQIQWSDKQVKAYLLSEKGIVLDSIDNSELERIITQRRAKELKSGEQRELLKKFARNFMRRALTPQN